jgi:anti-sigma-K factor RskA
MLKHPEILKEVLEIEAAIIKLTASISQNKSTHLFQKIKDKLSFNASETKVIQLSKPKTNWLAYSGWAAAIVLGAGLLWMANQNKELQTEIQTVGIERSYLETQIADAKTDLEASKNLLNVLRDKDIIMVPLGGQGNFATTYAKVYWDKKTNKVYLDAQGLPTAPKGKVYQVWSLTLNPLTPTSLGTIDDFNTDDNKIFEIQNANQSQAFGITLEPAGGSESPTMEQLYTLGVVAATP